MNKLSGIPFSFTAHGPDEFDKAQQFKLREKIRAASFVIGVSSFGRSQLYRFSETQDWPKVTVVHCGLGEQYLSSVPAALPKVPRLVCVGRLCEQKGQLVLVKACGILAARQIKFEVILAGDGDMRDIIEREISLAGIQDQVRVAGKGSEPKKVSEK